MEALLNWKAPEFQKKEKSKTWFTIMWIIFALLVALAVWQGSYTSTVLFILMAVVVYLYSLKEPKTLNYSITPEGIKIADELHKYDDIESFWVFYEPPEVKYVSLKKENTLGGRIHMPLGDQDPNEIREILDQFLPEEKQEESVADVLARNLRF